MMSSSPHSANNTLNNLERNLIIMNEKDFHPLFPRATDEETVVENSVIARAMRLRGQQLPEFIESAAELETISPASLKGIIQAVRNLPAYEAIGKTAEEIQDALWQIESTIVKRQLKQLEEIASAAPQLGSVTIRPEFVIPRDQTVIDIHRMPGGYWRQSNDHDIYPGALYDRGAYIYSGGRWGANSDLFGLLLTSFLSSTFPQLHPESILDVGCSVGHSTLPYAAAYPNADLFGIDVAAPLLRYAHARAAYKGASVRFIQADGTDTKFDGERFDLIVSHILFHELPVAKTRKFLQECYRLLKPGGVMAHIDLRPYRAVGEFPAMKPWEAFASNLDTFHNNEPYWQAARSANLRNLALTAGFSSDHTIETLVSANPRQATDPLRMLYVLSAVKQ
jgi:SAM-dependent methyltransferase